MPGNKCSNCIAFGSECTHLAAMAKKGRIRMHYQPPPIPALKTDLQAHINAILSSSAPYNVPNTHTSILVDLARYARQLEAELAAAKNNTSLPSVSPSSGGSTDPASSDEEPESYELTDTLRHFTIAQKGIRHFGKSSGMMLIKSTIEMKLAYDKAAPTTSTLRRPQFWTIHPWQRPTPEVLPPLRFPPPDFLDHLVSTFLSTTNVHLCLLHGPTFRREIAAGTHLTSRDFGNLVLGVCAYGSRHSDDPRVGPLDQAGWEWYLQLQPIYLSKFSNSTTLWELQLLPLMVLFLYGTTSPQPCFVLIGLGIRIAQDLGAHRKRHTTLKEWTVEDELWKRVFWVLVITDMFVSAFDGRPRATTSENFDLDYPLEVDEEFWPGEPLADPENPWTQPSHKPADVVSWILNIKLLDILSFAQVTIYSIKRSEYWDAISTSEWHENVAVELDSALNKWIDSIPDYLRWDPHKPDQQQFNRSVILYSTFYWVQLQVHRPFLPRPSVKKSSGKLKSNFPALAICANAARSCSHVLDVHSKRGGMVLPNILVSAFHSALVLLLNFWGGKHLGLSANPEREGKDIKKCMDMLGRYESRYLVAGRDIIRELFENGNPNGPDNQHEQSNKRSRDDREEESFNFSSEVNTNEWMPPLHTTELMGDWQSYLQENGEIFGEVPSFSDDYMSTMGVGEGIGVPSDPQGFTLRDDGAGWQDFGMYIANMDEFLGMR
ncbi:fungal-specific transcription factor domain-containing protein [Desarmillaria ectypa]|nr:fungal-specific transcription factor domain-containing protein [Desarmillaria ectypa]